MAMARSGSSSTISTDSGTRHLLDDRRDLDPVLAKVVGERLRPERALRSADQLCRDISFEAQTGKPGVRVPFGKLLEAGDRMVGDRHAGLGVPLVELERDIRMRHGP